uniref:Uncharacterized protein n=1 Tax=Oryza meridionalis TaxID=40149 RepID=A0A0E0DAM1_9ORYZ
MVLAVESARSGMGRQGQQAEGRRGKVEEEVEVSLTCGTHGAPCFSARAAFRSVCPRRLAPSPICSTRPRWVQFISIFNSVMCRSGFLDIILESDLVQGYY